MLQLKKKRLRQKQLFNLHQPHQRPNQYYHQELVVAVAVAAVEVEVAGVGECFVQISVSHVWAVPVLQG